MTTGSLPAAIDFRLNGQRRRRCAGAIDVAGVSRFNAPAAMKSRRGRRQPAIRRRHDFEAAVARFFALARKIAAVVASGRRRKQRTGNDGWRNAGGPIEPPITFDDAIGSVVTVDDHWNARLAGNDKSRCVGGARQSSPANDPAIATITQAIARIETPPTPQARQQFKENDERQSHGPEDLRGILNHPLPAAAVVPSRTSSVARFNRGNRSLRNGK